MPHPTNRHVSDPRSALSLLALVVPLALILVGCDSGGPMADGETTTISGQVTSSDTKASDTKLYSTDTKAKATHSGVEGATVTAVRLHADGSTADLSGEVTTDADGSYSIEIEKQAPGAVVLIEAEKSSADFRSSVAVSVTNASETKAQPMTPETHAEAQVYAEAESSDEDAEGSGEDPSAGTSLADVAALVDNDVASAILSGSTAPQDIASVVRAQQATEAAYNEQAEEGASPDAVAQAKTDAYEQLQSALATASDSADRARALEAFEEAMASAHVEAGASASVEAEIQQVGAGLTDELIASLPQEAQEGLLRRSQIQSGLSVAASVSKAYDKAGVSSGVASEVQSAQQELVGALRSAESLSDIRSATDNFRSAVKTSIGDSFAADASFAADQSTVTDAYDNLQSAISTLEDALSTATSSTGDANADAVASAFDQFYSNGLSTVQEIYTQSGVPQAHSQASARATVLSSLF